ncbi:MAG: sigma-70 family RNA polymerase sigma factor [Bradymonadales bacterium]
MKYSLQKRTNNYKRQVATTSLQQYLDSIKSYQVLTREEEYALTRAAQSGDEISKKRLINANLRLVVKIARDYQSQNAQLLDLIQEGNVGLLFAVEKFDVSKNIRLSTYAQFWIRAYILKFLMDNHRLVKIGATQNQRKLFYNLHKEEQKFRQAGKTPTTAALAQSLGVRENEITEMQQRLGNHELSLFAPIGGEDSDNCVIDSIASHDDSAEELIDQQFAANRIKASLEEFEQKLTGRDSQIWQLRMNSESPLTLQELGNVFSISRERARQLESRILKRLEKHLAPEREYIDAYQFGKACVLN